MEIVVGIVPYHRRIAVVIDYYLDDITGSSSNDRRTDIYTIFTLLMKYSVVDYMTDIATMASESIYRQMNLKYSASMLVISHMVNEIIESEDYQYLRNQINNSVANTSDKHLGVNDVNVTWNMSKVIIHVAGRRG